MNNWTWHGLFGATVATFGLLVSGCSGGGASGSTSTSATSAPPPAAIVLTTSSRSLMSDGSDSATLTASVVDSNNIAVSGAKVNFTSTSGQLGTSSGAAGSDGKVTIPFTAGTDPTNRTDVITAKVVGTSITSAIPVKIAGSTMTLSSTQTSNSTNDVIINALTKDVSGTAVSGQTIRFSIDSTACTGSTTCGNGTLSASTASTDTNGYGKVTLTPSASGSVAIKTEWLNGSGSVTATVTTSLSVTAVGTSFAVTTPTDNYHPVSLGLTSTQAFAATVPTSISGKTVASVRLVTTLGTWSNGQKDIDLTPSGNAISEVLTAGNAAGNANIQLDARDSTGATLATLNRVFALSAPASDAATVTLQASVSTIAPSTSGTTNSITLTATVRTASSGSNPANAVGKAPVLFEIVNSTGSGEEISPVLVYTNSYGQAQTTFTSGSQSSIGDLQLKATVLGVPATITDIETIYVNATAVSISLGIANVAQSADNSTNYIAPVSVLVVDNSGAAVKNALVSLSAFPTRYRKGYRDSECGPFVTGTFDNEDVNENEILDAGEDTNADGAITPAHATAGTVPSTVTTNDAGVATFNWTYQKQYANWVETRLRAKVVIATGTTESTNELKRWAPALIADMSPCTLPNSPFGL